MGTSPPASHPHPSLSLAALDDPKAPLVFWVPRPAAHACPLSERRPKNEAIISPQRRREGNLDASRGDRNVKFMRTRRRGHNLDPGSAFNSIRGIRIADRKPHGEERGRKIKHSSDHYSLPLQKTKNPPKPFRLKGLLADHPLPAQKERSWVLSPPPIDKSPFSYFFVPSAATAAALSDRQTNTPFTTYLNRASSSSSHLNNLILSAPFERRESI